MAMSRRRKDLIALFLVGLAFIPALKWRQISDWWYFLNYTPDAQIQKLADDAGMNQVGQRIFFRSDPALVDQAALDQACQAEDIGCITTKGKIYILDYDRATEHDQAIVTAAHEMLHAAYRRLSKTRRAEIDHLTTNEVTRLADPHLTSQLNQYHDESERADERHSILGSEFAGLSSQLETYYQTYFNDRSKPTTAIKRTL